VTPCGGRTRDCRTSRSRPDQVLYDAVLRRSLQALCLSLERTAAEALFPFSGIRTIDWCKVFSELLLLEFFLRKTWAKEFSELFYLFYLKNQGQKTKRKKVKLE
jgi:hypothetical protein